MDIGLMYGISIVSLVLIFTHVAIFIIRWTNYKYVGNRYLYAIVVFVVCLSLALMSNIFPIEIFSKVDVDGTVHTVKNVTETSYIAKIGSSVFEAVKMMGFGFEREKLSAYLANWRDISGHFHETLFGVTYFIASS